MKRLIPILIFIILLSCLTAAGAEDLSRSRGDYIGVMADAGRQLPPAAAEHYQEEPVPCGGVPYSNVPENEAVSWDWFENSCILGHSHAQGMELTLGIDTIDYYAQVALSAPGYLAYRDFALPNGGTGSYEDALRQKKYDKIYILLGTNDMPAGEAGLEDYRAAMRRIIETVQTLEPEARLYLLSLAPVGINYVHYAGESVTEKILLYNQALKSLARDYGAYYLDIFRPLCGSDALAESTLVVRDGLHFTAEGYGVIRDCILTHTG